MRHPKFQMVTNFDDIESFYYSGEDVLLLIALMHKTAFHPFRPCMFVRVSNFISSVTGGSSIIK